MQKALDDSIKPTHAKILANFKNLGENVNGWTYWKNNSKFECENRNALQNRPEKDEDADQGRVNAETSPHFPKRLRE